MASPLVSVIVPTRERVKTLAYTLATALDQQSEDFEVVVSDNASEDGTEELVRGIDDSRLRYFQTSHRLSMCDNYEFALEQARGDYVIFVGDDDAVMPGGIDFLLSRLGARNDLITHMWPLHIYDWPGEGSPPKIAQLSPQGEEAVLDLKAMARSVMRLGGWRYYRLPSPYHCAVPRSILDSIRTRTGRVFHSTQPDVFTAMAIPAFADIAVRLGRTVTLHGRSSASNGHDFAKRAGRSNIDRFISEYGDYQFHPSLFPGVAASANMIPDAVLRAKDMFPELYDTVSFDYSAMWAYVHRHRFVTIREVLKHSASIKRMHPLKVGRFLGFAGIHQIAAVRRTILDLFSSNRRTEPVAETIQGFVHQLSRPANSRADDAVRRSASN